MLSGKRFGSGTGKNIGPKQRPSRRVAAVAAAAVTALASHHAAFAGTSGVYSDTATGGLWSNPSNWTGGNVASGQDATADFSTLTLPADNLVHLNAAYTVGQLNFGDQGLAHNWSLDNNNVSTNVLTLSTSTGIAPVINVANDTTTISTSLTGTQGFTKTGSGILVLNGSNNYTGTTTISAGTLVLGALPTSFTAPTSGASLYLDASKGVTFNAGGVSQWADQSGNGRNASAGVGNVTLTSAGVNGHSALAFTGGQSLNDALSGSPTSETVFAVLSANVVTGTQAILGSSADGGLELRLNTNKLDALRQGQADLGSSTGTIAAATPEIVALTITPGSEAFYINGVAAGTLTGTLSATAGLTSTIGSRKGAADFLNGNLSALVVYNSVLNSTQIAATENYLNAEFNSGSTLASSSIINLNQSGAALSVANGAQTIAELTGVTGTNIYLGSSVLTVGDSNNTTYAGAFSDTGTGSIGFGGGINKQGTGKLTLSGPVSYTGNTYVSAGTLNITGNINSSGGATINSGATLILAGSNTFTGPLILHNGGILQLDATAGNTTAGTSNAIGTPGNSGGFQFSDGNSTGGATLQLRSDSSVTFANTTTSNSTGNTILNIDVNSLSGTTTNQTLTIGGPSGIYGTTMNVSGGSGYALAIGPIPAGNANFFTLNAISANVSTGAIGSTSSITGLNLNAAGGAITIGGNVNATSAISVIGNNAVAITGNLGGTTLNDSVNGTLTLGGAASTYTGITTINSGILNVASLANEGSASALGSYAASSDTGTTVGLVFNGSTATLQYTGSTPQSTNRQIRINAGTTAVIDASGTGAGTLGFTATSALGMFAGTGARTINFAGSNTGGNNFATPIADQTAVTATTSVLKTGAGKWILSGANTYTGNTNVAAGTLVVGGSIGSSAVTVQNGASLSSVGGTIAGAVTVAGGGSIDFSKDGLSSTTTTFGLSGGLTLGDSTANTTGLTFNINSSGTDQINDSGVLTVNSSGAKVNINSIGAISSGTNTYTLMSYTSQTGAGTISLGTTPTGLYHFSLIDGATLLQLSVTANSTPTTAYWTGNYDNSTWNGFNGTTQTTNFSTSSTGTPDAGQLVGSTTDVVFNATPVTGAVSSILGTNFIINSLTFNSAAAVGIGGSNSLTINAGASTGSLGYAAGTGLTVSSGAGPVTISAATLIPAASQNWANNSANPLTISSNVSGNATTGNTTTLTFNGTGSGNTTLSGVVGDGANAGLLAVAIATTGSGTTTFSNNDMFSGGLTITSGSALFSGNNTLAGAVTVNNGSVVFSGNNSFGSTAVVNGGNLLVSGNLAGAGGVLVTGGTAVLSGTNTFSGGVTTTGGTLRLGGGAALNVAAPVAVNISGGTLDLNTNSVAVGSLIGGTSAPAGTITDNNNSSGTTVLTDKWATATQQIFYGSINNGANGRVLALNVSGGGITALAGSSTYSGGTQLTAGTLQALNSNALGTGAVNLSGGAVALKIASGVTLPNKIVISAAAPGTGNGALTTVTATDTATFSGEIDYNATLSSGGLIVGPTTSGLLSFTGPIIEPSVNPPATLNVRGGIVQLADSTGNSSYGSLTISTTGLSIGHNNGIATNAVLSIGTSAAGTLDLNGYDQTVAGILQVNNAAIITNSLTAANTGPGDGSNGTSILTVNTTASAFPDSAPDSYPGLISSYVELVKAGPGTLALTGTNNSYLGGTVIQQGVLAVSALDGGNVTSPNGLGYSYNGANDLVFASPGGTLRYTGATGSTSRAFTINDGVTATLDVSTAGAVLTANGNAQVDSTESSAPASFNKGGGAGTLILTGNLPYHGNTGVAGGTLLVNGTVGTSGSGNINILAGATLGGTGTVNGTLNHTAGTIVGGASATVPTSGALTFTGPLTLNGGTVLSNILASSLSTSGVNQQGYINANGGLTFGTTPEVVSLQLTGALANGTYVYNLFDYTGTYSGTPNLSYISSLGRATLTTDLSTPGQINVDIVSSGSAGLVWNSTTSSTWDVHSNGVAGSGTANWYNTGSNVAADKFFQGDNVTFADSGSAAGSGILGTPLQTSINISSGVTVTPGSVTVTANTTNYTIGGPGTLGGTGALTLSGASTLTLASSNSYSGGTNINGGILALGNASAIGSSGTISFGGGTLQYSAVNTTDYSSRFSTASNQAISIDTNGQNVTLASSLTSSGGTLTKLGTGTLSLTATGSSFNGGTNISAGTIATAGTVGAASSPVLIGTNGTLAFTGGGTDTNTVTGTGNITSLGVLITGDESGFAGTFTHNSSTASTNFTTSLATSANAAYVLAVNQGSLQGFIATNGGMTLNIGSLTGVTNSLFRGSNSGTAGTTILSIGNLGTSTVDNGIIADGINVKIALTKVGAGSLTLNSADTYSQGTNVSNGALIFGAPAAFPTFTSLTVGTGALAQAANHSTGVTGSAKNNLFASSLSIAGSMGAWTGKVDLGNNDLVVQNGSLTTITNQVKTGYKTGNWQGNGIISSAAAGDPTRLTTLGVIQNSVDGTATGTVLYASGTTFGAFDGATASADTDVLVKYTYFGDTNLDGKVDASDYSRIDAAFLANQSAPGTYSGWYNGDFNYDGVINGSDYTLMDNAFNTQGALIASEIAPNAVATAEIAPSGTSAVPEPTSLGLLGIGVVGLLGRRARRRCR
jgi:autotransporter-associated beta strand protein